ncbi:AGE family epimerase/isomerase [Roseobacter fucihabitans]|nr:AGE family epimerase/isomerase [Roseobacter litoralis]
MSEAERQWTFFAASLRDGPGFFSLDTAGNPLSDDTQELHSTTRLIHAFALGQISGHAGADRIVEHGMAYLRDHHHDAEHGGYLWALRGDAIVDDRKLAYGHVFVLLAGASAKMAGHPDADALITDVSDILDKHYWEEDAGLFADEWNRDWTPFSTYRGMNANMHAVEALLTAYEATGQDVFLSRAGRILEFFTARIAPAENWRLPEHYSQDWEIDRSYAGNPMFRPAGTTPGHSFELGRLLLQFWDLSGRQDRNMPVTARHLIERALKDAWCAHGGLAYTLEFGGKVSASTRFWWPVTEAIGAVAALIKLDRQASDEQWYRKLWTFADTHFIDHIRGGWFPEIDNAGQVTSTIFKGKPDIYHSVQACLFPLTNGLSGHIDDLKHSEPVAMR